MGLMKKYKKEHGIDDVDYFLSGRWRYDPRPDLKDDHEFWTVVLQMAEKANGEAYGNLHGMRCMGTRLESVGKNLRIVPADDIGPEFFKYEKYKQKYLSPHAEQIVEIMTSASQEVL